MSRPSSCDALPDTTVIYETKPEQAEKGMDMFQRLCLPATILTRYRATASPIVLFSNINESQKDHAGRRSWSELAVRKNRAHANIICGYAADAKQIREATLGTTTRISPRSGQSCVSTKLYH